MRVGSNHHSVCVQNCQLWVAAFLSKRDNSTGQRLSASVGLRLVLRMSDPADARMLYVDPVGADAPAGRGSVDGFGATIQVAVPIDGPAGLIARISASTTGRGCPAPPGGFP